MNRVFVVIGLFAVSLAAAADPIRLKFANGDVISGEIKSESDTAWVVSHPTLGDLTIAKRDAAPVASQAKKSTTTLTNKKTVAATQPRTKSSLKKRLTLGLNGNMARRHSQSWHVGFDLLDQTPRTNWKLKTSWFYRTSDGREVDNDGRAIFDYDWYFNEQKRHFLFARAETYYDEPTDWELRNSLYGGVGLNVAQSERGNFQLRSGAGASYEHGSVREWQPEAIFAAGSTKWKLTEYQSLVGELAFYPNVEEFETYRTNLMLEWRSKLPDVKGMSLRFGIRDTYDADATNKNDNTFRYFAGIVYDL